MQQLGYQKANKCVDHLDPYKDIPKSTEARASWQHSESPPFNFNIMVSCSSLKLVYERKVAAAQVFREREKRT